MNNVRALHNSDNGDLLLFRPEQSSGTPIGIRRRGDEPPRNPPHFSKGELRPHCWRPQRC